MASAVLGLAGFGFRVSKGVPTGNAPRPELGDGEEAKAWLFYERSYPTGSIPEDAIEKAWRASLQAVAPPADSDAPAAPADHWTSIGPAPITGGQIEAPIPLRVTGRLLDIAVDPSDPTKHWFVAAEGGGIWETTDAGSNWIPKTDGEASVNMTTVALAPSNPQILFVGTRDYSRRGVGLLKSVNGGASWNIVNQVYRDFIAIKVHPTDPNIVLAIAKFSHTGVVKSVDGGASFCRMLPGNGTALQIDPTNFNRQYAAIRDGAGSPSNGIFRSVDEGATWTRITSALWDNYIRNAREDVKIAIGPLSEPGTLYIIVPPGPGPGGLWRTWKTRDAWATTPSWEQLNPMPAEFTNSEAVLVDPNNPNILYTGGLGSGGFWRYQGKEWVSIVQSTHIDQRALAAVGNMLLVGNDGGFWTSTDLGESWTNRNANLATVQFYAGSLHPTDPTAALGGSQDNGTEWWTGSSVWTFKWYGDGGYNAFSATDPDIWLVSSQYLEIIRLRNAGTINEGGLRGLNTTGAAFTAPIRRSPHDNVLLAGSNNLWKSTNFFTEQDPDVDLWTSNGPEEGAPISAIAFAPSDGKSLTYAYGTVGGRLRLTVVGGGEGTNWTDLDPLGDVPGRPIKAIAFHPDNPATIYVAISSFNENTGYPGHVFKTVNGMDANPTWADVSPGPPGEPAVNLPMNALAIDPSHPETIYVGADLGVWKSTNGGSSWTFMGPGSGMPNVPVFDLLFSPADGRLIAFTHGRGAFRLNTGVPETGSLQVTLAPAAAVAAGARWRVDYGAFQNSGTTLSGLSAGSHTVSFSSVNGYATPANQLVTINANQTTTSNGVYSIPVPQVANFATRLDVGTQDNVMIGGFIIDGPICSTKQIVLRGLGPSTNVSGYLEDPYIELHRANGSIVTANDNWGEAPNLSQIPAYLRPAHESESVILTSLEPGSYTLMVRGVKGGTGVGLFEAYDLEPTSSSKLANASTRGFVQTGDGVMIGGFILTGANSRVVLRGLGPSLPIPNEKLPDPLIELRDANGAILVINDDWRDASNFNDIPVDLQPANIHESAILRTFAPGTYTVILRGANGETGIGLFEAYPLDI